MSPAYRAHSLAQTIEEAVRILGPEVTAAALLAVVRAAPVRPTTQRAEPSTASKFGYFCPSRSLRRKLWTTLAVIAFAALAGAVVSGGGREPRDDAASPSAPVNAVSSSEVPTVPASAIEPATAARSSPPESPKAACEGDTLDGKCIAAEAAAARQRPSPNASPTDAAPPSKSQRATDATTTTPATNPPPQLRSSERHRASAPRAMTGAAPMPRMGNGHHHVGVFPPVELHPLTRSSPRRAHPAPSAARS